MQQTTRDIIAVMADVQFGNRLEFIYNIIGIMINDVRVKEEATVQIDR